MAKQQVQQDFSDTDKLKHYSDVLSDPNATARSRGWAKMRIDQLSKKLSQPAQSQPQKAVARKSTLPATDQQNNAKNAGIGFGAAKVGARVPVAPENQQSFKDGVKIGRALGNRF